ncbi:MAG: peptidoglycan-associated lipoprotein Pal [Candidatus Puniceispirillales bacterium WSBS_2018_MAG_OTU23]
MTNRILVLIAAIGLLAACATASQDKKNAGGAEDASTSASASTSTTASSGSGSSAGTGSVAEQLTNVGDTVYFGYDSASLTADARSVLAAQAAFLSANPSVTITVEGHCDERGTREYNLALGDRRASAARDYLVAQGVNAARIKTISYGKERPSFIGSNAYAYDKNRRSVSIIK